MTAFSRRRTRPRVLAVIAPGEGPHLIAPARPTPRTSARPLLPRAGLDDALSVCLDLLERDPPRFQRAAIAWHARWCSVVPTLTLAEAQVTLAALEALAGPDPVDGARELRRQSVHHGLSAVVRVLDAWIGCGSAESVTPLEPARPGVLIASASSPPIARQVEDLEILPGDQPHGSGP